jgi:hypothetical protein
MSTRWIALLALTVVAVAGCNRQPRYSDAVAARLRALAPKCTSEINTPGGYDEILTCTPDSGPTDGMVVVMRMDDRIAQLNFDLVVPTVEQAIAKLEPALEGVVERKDLNAIFAELRRARPMGKSGRPAKATSTALVGIDQDAPGAPITVQLLLDFRTS